MSLRCVQSACLALALLAVLAIGAAGGEGARPLSASLATMNASIGFSAASGGSSFRTG